MKKTTVRILTALLACLLCGGLIFALAACKSGGNGDETTMDTTPGDATQAPSDGTTAESKPAETTPEETKGGTDDPATETITLSALLAQSKTNVDVFTTGVVFAKTANGIYVADGDVCIFVKGGDANVGDEVLVEGTYRVSAGMPLLSALTVKTTASGKTTPAPAAASLSAIAALKGEKTDFSKPYAVHGVLTIDEAGHYTLSDGDARVTLEAVKSLDNLLTKDVSLTVVTGAYDASNGWTLVCVNEDEISETPFDLAGAAEEIFAAAAVKDTVTGKLTLVGSLTSFPNVTLTWSVVSGEAITIENNEASVQIVTADSASVLKLTLTCDQQTQEKTFNVTVKAPRTLKLSELASVKPAEDEVFYVEGTVISQASNQGGDVLSVVLYADGALYRVDLDEATIRSFAIGAQIKALVSYDPANLEEGSYDVTALRGLSASKTSDALKPVDLSTLPCVTLESEADFDALFKSPYTEVTLYKIVNPYFSRSTSSDTNFFRFGATVEQSKQGLDKTQYTGFYMRAENGINRNAEILAAAGISLPGDTSAVKFDGITVYALGVFRGKTTMQLIIPSEDCIILSLEATVAKIKDGLPQTTFDASSAGEFALPSTDTVTWTCDSSLVTIADGKAKYAKVVGDDQTVTLVGSFTYMGTTQTVEITVTLTGAPIPTYTVSDLTEDGVIAKLECVVVGMAPSHGGTVSKYPSYGLYVSDGKTVVLLSADKTLIKVTGYEFTIGGQAVNVGDKLFLTNVAYKADSKTLSAADGFTVEVTATGVDTSAFDYADADMQVTITNQAELQAFVEGGKEKNLKVIKVVADADHPVYIAAQNGYLLALNYLTDGNKDDTTGNAYKYSDQVWTLNVCPFAFAFGEEWAVANTPIKSIDSGNTYGSTTSQQPKDNYAASTYAFTGTLYLVYEYTTSSAPYYNFTGVLAGSTLTPLAP